MPLRDTLVGRRGLALLVAGLLAGSAAVGCSGGDDGGRASDQTTGIGGSDGTGDTTPDTSPGELPVEEKAQWTFMVYFSADNNLEAAALRDIVEMSTVGSSAEVNLVAFIDRADNDTEGGAADQGESEDSLLNVPNFTTAKILHVQNGSLDEVGDFGEIDSGDPQTLAWFIDQTIRAFPADHYATVLWDHGLSWASFGQDDDAGSDLNLAEIRAGIASGVESLGGRKLDLLAFDACLMAAFEVAAAVEPFADYLMASEELVPNDGFDYLALAALQDAPTMSGEQLASALLTAYANFYADTSEASITMSIVDLARLGALNTALRGFAQTTTDAIEDSVSALGRARSEATRFAVEHGDEGFVDLGDLLARMDDLPDQVRVARDAFLGAMELAVVGNFAGEGNSRATGMSIYFPPTSVRSIPDYEQIPGIGEWRLLLDAYFESAGTPEGGSPQFLSSTLDYQLDGTGILGLAGFVPGTEAAVTDIRTDAVVLTDVATLLLRFPGELVDLEDGTPVAVSTWAFDYFVLGDGSASDVVSTILFYGDDNLINGSSLVFYQGPGSDPVMAVLEFVVDFAAGRIRLGDLYVQSEEGGIGAVTLEPGATVYPAVQVERPGAADAEFVASPVALDPTGLTMSIETLPSGTEFGFRITAFDAVGNEVSATAIDVVP